MSRNIVADFSAYVSVVRNEEQVLEERGGRIVVSREDVTVSAGDGRGSHQLPLRGLMDFDFQTVPEAWEQFFDDLVGVRFDTDDGEAIITVGTDTEIADRYVTVLLRLLLEDTTTQVTQRLAPIDGEEQLNSEATTFTLLPDSEQLTFTSDDLAAIDISTITNIVQKDEEGSIIVCHLYEEGRAVTKITPDTSRPVQFLHRYLDFRAELADGTGPVRFLYLGENRDSLLLVGKLLKHRRLEFEAGHVTGPEKALEALESSERTIECIVAEFALPHFNWNEVYEKIRQAGHETPIVYFIRNREEEVPETTDTTGVRIVQVGSRTEHYEDVVDAIERSVIERRIDGE